MTNLVFLVAPARSGAGLLEAVLRLDKKWSVSKYSNPERLIEYYPADVDSKYSSHLLRAEDSSNFKEETEAPDGQSNQVAYNPRLTLQVDFLSSAFPEAKFIFVARSPLDTIASSVAAWTSGKFVTEPDLADWWGEKWSFALVPGWKELIGKPIPEIAAKQWQESTSIALESLSKLDPSRWTVASFEALVDNPKAEIERVIDKLGLSGQWAGNVPAKLPASLNALNKRQPGKPRKPNGEVMAALGQVAETVKVVNELRAPLVPQSATARQTAANLPASRQKKESVPSAGTPYANSYTAGFREFLSKSEGTIFITTYKTGHVISVRQDDDGLNVDMMTMKKPMGMALSGGQLAIGLEQSIKTWVDMPSLSGIVEPKDKNTSVYIPRHEVFTGDVAIHEMAYGTKKGFEGLWWVNTKFSALCKLDINYSWQPVWRPNWITEYAAEDRCHVNGLAMVEGRPKFVTALSQSNEPHGWRAHKGTSGVIVDIESNKIVASGLSMPHSPRFHNGKLWVLESGKGSIGTVDLETGEVSTVATLPGFTRGLSFLGKYAVIGLSQVRESVFKDLPVTQQTEERACGVWIVDTETGKTVGILKFQGAIQEIFDVKFAPKKPWTTILEPDAVTALSYHLPDKVLNNLSKPRPKPKN